MAGESYYENPRHEMLPFVPTGARTILDIGCGAGAFAGLVKTRAAADSVPEIWGIEMDPTAAGLAGKTLDRVMVGQVQDILPGLPDGHFDCVVLNDVLEHLLEPGDLLVRLRPALRPDAVLVASIPNVRYFFNVVDLAVHGRWDYTDEGILDRTHLRFFTRGSMVRMFQEAGFTVDQAVGINPTGSLKFQAVNLMTLGRWSDMRFLQFAISARLTGEQG